MVLAHTNNLSPAIARSGFVGTQELFWAGLRASCVLGCFTTKVWFLGLLSNFESKYCSFDKVGLDSLCGPW